MEKAKSIHLLNQAVADELQAVHQYMYFHFHLDDQGFKPLSQLFKRIAIQEMGHIEVLADRILFLKGDVEMVAAGPVEKILEPDAILLKVMAMEEDGVKSYNKAAQSNAPPMPTPPPSNSSSGWSATKKATSISTRSSTTISSDSA